MAQKKRQPVEAASKKSQYRVTVREFKGQINDRRYQGQMDDLLELEPWEAQILSAYVQEVEPC